MSRAQAPRKRLTRQESRELTRSRLLDAAAVVFAERGFGGSTVELIAEQAGYTRGAFYSNFADKDEIFLAIVEERSRRGIREISGLLDASKDPTEFVHLLKERGERDRQSKQNRRWALLSAEFWLYALRNPKARRMLAEHQRHLREAYGSAISAIFTQLQIRPPAAIDRLATVVLGLDEGIIHQHWIDPEAVPAEVFYDALELLISAAVALHQQGGPHT